MEELTSVGHVSRMKYEAVLRAGARLFAELGFAQTSMDAVAAAAQVSKRTAYGYFGDKRGLLTAAYGAMADAVVDLVRMALDEKFDDDVPLTVALTGFAQRISSSALQSDAYATLRRLDSAVAQAGLTVDERPEHLLGERLAARKDVDVRNAFRAAEHFTALTFEILDRARNRTHRGDAPTTLSEEVVNDILADGVRVFVAAYESSSDER